MSDKGGHAEEALRAYFTDLGYFVVRGMSVRVAGSEVTDIDLWLYNRPSPLTRERLNVDIKNKKTPQALERIFWTKGVQTILGFDGCIVATSDKRPEAVEFGRTHGVTVLDGNLLRRICEKSTASHLSDDDLRGLAVATRRTRGAELGWYDRARANASVLGSRLGFDACNHLLPEIRFFVEQALIGGARTEEALRYVYLHVAYFLVSLDYSLSDSAFLSAEDRQRRVEEGLRYGQAGRAGTERLTEMAIKLAAASVPGSSASAIRHSVRRISEEYPVEVIADYVARTAVFNSLFILAREFKSHVHRADLPSPLDLVNGAKAFIFVLLDFFGVERTAFVSACAAVEGTDNSKEDQTASAEPTVHTGEGRAVADQAELEIAETTVPHISP